MNEYLFHLTIGPVQGFISQARKTQDLFAGSRWLSDLARKGYELLKQEFPDNSIELIFPQFGTGKASTSNPNLFSVRIKTDKSAAEVKAIGKAVRQNLIQGFVKQGLSTLQFMEVTQQRRAKKQLEDQLEVYWAAVPITAEGYATAFKSLASYINGSKNFRPFRQLEEAGRKCGVDGQRNVLAYRRTHRELPGKKNMKLFHLADFQPHFTDVRDESEIRVSDLQPGEGLSAVSFAKRRYLPETDNFPSTAAVCLMHDLEKIKVNTNWETQITKANGLLKHPDDQLFFEENINGSVFLKTGQFGTDEQAAARAAKDALKSYRKTCVEIEKARIKVRFSTKYFAVLVFDGDGMGDWLSGKFLEDGFDLLAFHTEFARLLHDFGGWAQDFLNAPRGRAVYAGGDDFLGFLNLVSLMDTLTEIRKAFDEKVNQPLKASSKAFTVKAGQNLNISAGIAIGHYKQPLDMVLKEARDAEKLAKKSKKNALAISLIRHSGGTTRCVRPFGSMELKNLEAIKTVIEALGAKQFSNKFIHNLIKETQLWRVDINSEQLAVEIKRLLIRAKDSQTPDEVLDQVWKALQFLIEADYHQFLVPDSKDARKIAEKTDEERKVWLRDQNAKALANFLATLRICDFIYRITHDNEE